MCPGYKSAGMNDGLLVEMTHELLTLYRSGLDRCTVLLNIIVDYVLMVHIM